MDLSVALWNLFGRMHNKVAKSTYIEGHLKPKFCKLEMLDSNLGFVYTIAHVSICTHFFILQCWFAFINALCSVDVQFFFVYWCQWKTCFYHQQKLSEELVMHIFSLCLPFYQNTFLSVNISQNIRFRDYSDFDKC